MSSLERFVNFNKSFVFPLTKSVSVLYLVSVITKMIYNYRLTKLLTRNNVSDDEFRKLSNTIENLEHINTMYNEMIKWISYAGFTAFFVVVHNDENVK